MLTSDEMKARLRGLAGRNAALFAERADLALSAVNGEPASIARRAAIDVELTGINAEADALREALAAVVEAERLTAEHLEAAERERQIMLAREQAVKIVELAARVDETVATFKSLLEGLASAERATLAALHAAGKSVSGAVAGQKEIASTAAARMRLMLEGNDRFINNRPTDVKHVAATAWRDLIAEHDDV